jgi:hypothetical protein
MNRLLSSGLVTTTVVTLLATTSNRETLAAPTSKTPTTQPAPNARDFYKRAAKELNSDFQGRDFPLFNDAKLNAAFSSPWKRREAVLSRNERALSLIRRGFAFPYSRLPYKSQWDLAGENGFSFLASTRQLARLLYAEADVHAHRGAYSKAIHSSLDSVRLSKDISRGSVVDLLVGNAIAAIGKSRIKQSTINKLNAAEAKAAARRLETIEMRNVSYADVLREEKRFGQIMLVRLFKMTRGARNTQLQKRISRL